MRKIKSIPSPKEYTKDDYPNAIFAETDTAVIILKYSKEAEENDLIKIIPKAPEVILSADDILEIIAKNVKDKPLALALTSTNVNNLLMTEVERSFSFTADKEYKAGDKIEFRVNQSYPAVLAALEQIYNLCKQKGNYMSIDPLTVHEAVLELSKNNENFMKAMYGLGADTKSLLQTTKEEGNKET